MVKPLLRLILAAAFIGIFSLPPDGLPQQPKPGGTLTLAIKRRMNLMNPMVQTRSTENMIRGLMFEPLVGMDLKGAIHPQLAESWKVSSDGKTYVFQLRKGVKFHDGREMTAKDVKFSMDYTMDPRNGAYGYRRLDIVERVEAPDKHTLKIALKAASAPFLASLTTIQAFPVVPAGSLEVGVAKPSRFPPGTGPFKFKEWQPQRRIVFERFDDYWGEKAFIDGVVLRPILDATIRFTTLRTGEADMVEISPYEWVKKVVAGEVEGIKAVAATHASFRRLTFNVAGPPFDNLKMRRAVAHAINRQEAMEAAYLGFGAATEQVYPRDHLWFAGGIESPPYDPERAKALLKEAGYHGEPIELMVSAGVYNEAVALAVQSQLRKIGMNVKLNLAERGTGLQLRRQGNYAFRTGGGSVEPDPYEAYVDFRCEQDLKKRIRNESGYCDKNVDALMEKLRIVRDLEKRKQLLRQVVGRLQEDVPQVNIGYAPEFFTLRTTVKGFSTDSNGSFVWWGGGLSRTWLDR